MSRCRDCGLVRPERVRFESFSQRSDALHSIEWDSRARPTTPSTAPGRVDRALRSERTGAVQIHSKRPTRSFTTARVGAALRDGNDSRCTPSRGAKTEPSAMDAEATLTRVGGLISRRTDGVASGIMTRARRPRFARGPSNLTGNPTRRVRASVHVANDTTRRADWEHFADTSTRGVASPQAGNESLRASRPLGLRASL